MGENIIAQVRPYNRKEGYKNLVTQEDIEILFRRQYYIF